MTDIIKSQLFRSYQHGIIDLDEFMAASGLDKRIAAHHELDSLIKSLCRQCVPADTYVHDIVKVLDGELSVEDFGLMVAKEYGLA